MGAMVAVVVDSWRDKEAIRSGADLDVRDGARARKLKVCMEETGKRIVEEGSLLPLAG